MTLSLGINELSNVEYGKGITLAVIMCFYFYPQFSGVGSSAVSPSHSSLPQQLFTMTYNPIKGSTHQQTLYALYWLHGQNMEKYQQIEAPTNMAVNGK